MSKDGKELLDAAEVAANVGAAAVAVVGATGAIATGAAVVPAAVAGIAYLSQLVLGRREKKLHEWWDILVGANASDRGIEAEIIAKLQDPKDGEAAKELIDTTVRTLGEAASKEVIPALAILARKYLQAGKSADRFARGLMRLLRELDPGELAQLRMIVLAVPGYYERHGRCTPVLQLRIEEDRRARTTFVAVTSTVGRAQPIEGADVRIGRRMIGLLRDNELDTGAAASADLGSSVNVKVETMVLVAEVLAPR